MTRQFKVGDRVMLVREHFRQGTYGIPTNYWYKVGIVMDARMDECIIAIDVGEGPHRFIAFNEMLDHEHPLYTPVRGDLVYRVVARHGGRVGYVPRALYDCDNVPAIFEQLTGTPAPLFLEGDRNYMTHCDVSALCIGEYDAA